MTHSTKLRLLLLSALAFSIEICSAAVPSGEADFFFDSNVLPLYDFTGTFQPTNGTIRGAGGQDLPFSSAVDLVHDAHGRLTGSGTTALGIGSDVVGADYKASGRVSGGGTGTRVNLTTRFKGTGVISGLTTTFNISVNYKLAVNSSDGTLVGTARGDASFSRVGGGAINSDVAVPIATGTNASWVLQLFITPLKKLGGSGNVILADGRTLTGNLLGNYSSQKDQANLKWTGINDSKGSSLKISMASVGETNLLLSLKGKVLGQSVRQ